MNLEELMELGLVQPAGNMTNSLIKFGLIASKNYVGFILFTHNEDKPEIQLWVGLNANWLERVYFSHFY